MKKVAIVYDRVNKWGGAERVLLALHEIFPDAPLYTSVYNSKNASWAKVFPEIRTSFLQKLPFARSNHEFLGTLMPLAFESFDFSGFDLVISVTSEAAKGIRTKPGTLHICYCLTPTRYLWSHRKLYFQNPIAEFVSRPIVNYLKRWDKDAAQKPDLMVAISTEVRNRIKNYYDRETEIIFPPAGVLPHNPQRKRKEKYYLLVSRLDYGYKKIDVAIRAFNKLGYQLVVIGTGRLERKLRKMAKRNIKFVGKISEKDLAGYYSNARALIMPQEEDFGIVSVEAQSFGVPVIAYNKGGAIDTVIPEITGVFFERQTPESLINAIAKFEKMRFVVDNLFTNSQRFSKEVFKRRILDVI